MSDAYTPPEGDATIVVGIDQGLSSFECGKISREESQGQEWYRVCLNHIDPLDPVCPDHGPRNLPTVTEDGLEHDVREWKTIGSTGIDLLAINADGTHELIGCMVPGGYAQQVVAEHRLVTTPYYDDEHRGGSWVVLLTRQAVEIDRLQKRVRELEKTHD